MSTLLDKLMQAMAAAASEGGESGGLGGDGEGENGSNEAGAMLLAFIRQGAANAYPFSPPPLPSPVSSFAPESISLAAVLGLDLHSSSDDEKESKIRYDRDFLFSCGESAISREVSKSLAVKLDLFPEIKRRVGSSGEVNQVRLNDRQPSMEEPSALPPRPPTAQIFNWNPNVEQWVPRPRPQKV